MQSRLTQLEEFYNQDPDDPFNIYALALEYQKVDIQKTRNLFELLLTKFPTYIPTYYHAGKLYESLNLRDDALKVFQKGIDEAKRANDTKAVRELQSAYNELLFD